MIIIVIIMIICNRELLAVIFPPNALERKEKNVFLF